MTHEDLRLLEGGRGLEKEIPCHIESPTWILNEAWNQVKEVCQNALDAYLEYCRSWGLPHSYLLGLDVLITGVADSSGRKVVDIRPTLLEGPCCNSYPACPNFFASRLYGRAKAEGYDPDSVEYPVHPTRIIDKVVECFQAIWEARGHKGRPVIGVFTRPYPESEEESAHVIAIEAFKKAGHVVYRITPEENPYVEKGKIHVAGVPIDMCYRRIERIHVPMFYGWELAMKIIYETPNTIWINPFKIDDLRSKTIEEKCFREYERKTGKKVSRPITLLGEEINPDSVRSLLETGGYAVKRWNSTGGKGVFLHVFTPLTKGIYDRLYGRYDGRHMVLVDERNMKEHLAQFENFKENTAIQQMRIIDSREISGNRRLVYDTRINCLYNELRKEWDFISGISRCVPCGPDVTNGNSLLTNVSSGANLSPLIIGKSKKEHKRMTFGPLLSAMLQGKTEYTVY